MVLAPGLDVGWHLDLPRSIGTSVTLIPPGSTSLFLCKGVSR